jgi:hypothetical protein
MKTYCICSASTKEDLEKLINKYFLPKNYVITEDNRVYNTNTGKYFNSESYIVVERKNRYQFRRRESK